MQTKFPTPAALIHLHTKTLPPPCFTVGHKLSVLNASFRLLQILTLCTVAHDFSTIFPILLS